MALLVLFEENKLSPTVKVCGSPCRGSFVFKDGGSVLVFRVPLIVVCLSDPYSVCFDEKA